MNELQAPMVTSCALEIVSKIDFDNNPFFRALLDGSITREEFCLTQEQFYFAVAFFPRPMAALVGRLPEPEQRLDILHNVVEEHGEFDEAAFHKTTFEQFLHSLGSDVEALKQQPDLWPEVRAFNSVLTGSCLMDELEVGLACMGVIELSFARLSSIIGRAVVEQGWIPKSKLVHYRIHEAIDERHADEFFRVLEPLWEQPQRRYYIKQGLQMGTYIFYQLYESLYKSAKAQLTSPR